VITKLVNIKAKQHALCYSTHGLPVVVWQKQLISKLKEINQTLFQHLYHFFESLNILQIYYWMKNISIIQIQIKFQNCV